MLFSSLVDADFLDMDYESLDQYICTFQTQNVDLLVFPTTKFYLFNRLSRHNILFAGARLIKTVDLKNMFSEETPSRYQLEIAINRYMLRHKKKARYAFFSYTPVPKTQKIGLIRGLFSNSWMLLNVLSYRFPTYIQQLLFFGHERITRVESKR